jgi:tetratricopeptide (TPR) repeat protein
MRTVAADLVDIMRDYLVVHQKMGRLLDRYRSGDLVFSEIRQLISDDESSVLFRLKERCHASFRPRDDEASVAMRREALFDLAVGSLFHEAMKFRESFYQKEVYGPRVGALRSQSTSEADAFFDEFEKILDGVAARLEEGSQETEILIAQTGQQLRVLLAFHPNNALVLRHMIENPEPLEAVFGLPLDELLAELEGDAAAAFSRAGRSYLDSGFYEEAKQAFADSIARGGSRDDLAPLADYCRGMMAYLSGDYRQSVERLGEWFASANERDEVLVEIARAAMAKVDQLVDQEDGEAVASDATALAGQLTAAGA